MFGLVPFERRPNELGNTGRYTDMDTLFDNFMREAFAPFGGSGLQQMNVDIRETETEYILEADLPGVTKDQVSLEIEDDRLVLSVTEDKDQETKNEGYICRERRYGRTSRSFSLENIDAEKISGALSNGTLTVTLPKKVAGGPKRRRIDIA